MTTKEQGFAVATAGSADRVQVLREKIKTKQARAGVFGLGYVGLPLAVEFAHCGFPVTGIDLDTRKISEINSGRSYIADVPTKDVAELVSKKRLRASSDYSVLSELDTVNICVPTPLSKAKDP